MGASERFLVVQFVQKSKNHLVVGDIRYPSSAAAAERMAFVMSERFAGTAAYSVQVDKETGDMTDPKLLKEFGSTIDIMSDL